ncbi:proline--tRNA ligase [Candidatus Pacearchaeota archaeon CG_4_9_14_3_um_filter_31_7]|nr:MAG: proline--tRNA ligase [Candidatus Pacearchaeota archaeon CG1_02_31_27]PIN92353.1 MAG: proline--tRNA ligase [Candidatus Pacearchaeota archaeon CG10_big_fil_rev_8_21_14_0_10_31_59]PJA70640.1 MAG: proline--tRNA ligase [Candidatus Pacearchaeota archaeon CG_4_9_14_3_um_filter_31_7]
MEQETSKITFNISKEKNFSEWYSEIIAKAELADLRYNVKGFLVFQPWSVEVMEIMYDILESILKRKGHRPYWFPAVIPEENFKKESEHIKGFTPQVFWITEAGNEKFNEKLALRPTSETAMYQMYSLWIRSYRDLPFKAYQRAQVWRYETKATRPFIRSREFYWVETHNCFATRKDSELQIKEDMETTYELLFDNLCVPSIFLERPQWDKFPGAITTSAADTLMPDGKMIQLPSTHLLGQGFAKVFDIKFKDNDKKEKYVWQTCYGPAISRIFAGLISWHGDDKGLVYPFKVSPIQIIIVPIYKTENKTKVIKKSMALKKKLAKEGFRVNIDLNETKPGEKFYFWEMKGVPLRLEVGEREINDKEYILFLRDENRKIKVDEEKLTKLIHDEGKKFDERLKKKTKEKFESSIVSAKTKEEIKKAVDSKKIAKINFCSLEKDGEKCAEVIEKEINAEVRGKKIENEEKPSGKCVICGKPAKVVVYIARSY